MHDIFVNVILRSSHKKYKKWKKGSAYNKTHTIQTNFDYSSINVLN